jgi:hypothetical protein
MHWMLNVVTGPVGFPAVVLSEAVARAARADHVRHTIDSLFPPEERTLKSSSALAPQAPVAERVKSRSRLQHREGGMRPQFHQRDLYELKTLEAVNQAFDDIWNTLREDDPFRDHAEDRELKTVIGQKLTTLVGDGVTDARQLRKLTLESLLLRGYAVPLS